MQGWIACNFKQSAKPSLLSLNLLLAYVPRTSIDLPQTAANIHTCKYKTRTVLLSTLADRSVLVSWFIKIVFLSIHECFAAVTASVAPVKGIYFLLIFLRETVTKAVVWNENIAWGCWLPLPQLYTLSQVFPLDIALQSKQIEKKKEKNWNYIFSKITVLVLWPTSWEMYVWNL